MKISKTALLICTALLASAFSSDAFADQLTAGDLFSWCKDKYEPVKAACRYYILGVVEGVALGDGAVMSNGRAVERKQTHFCLPTDISGSQMVDLFVGYMNLDARTYPQDLQLPAVSMVDGIMHHKYPCAP